MSENQQDTSEEIIPPPTTGSDLLDDSAPEPTVNQKDEDAIVAGVEAVGRISIFIAHAKQTLKTIWDTPKYRYSAITGIALILIGLAAWPTSRYATLNTAGFRATARVVVIDEDSNRPVTGVTVSIGDIEDRTDDEGIAKLENVRLGKGSLIIDKEAYAESATAVQIGLGNNTIEDIKLSPIGTQFSFSITDWLSDEPLENVRITQNDNEALSDSDGIALLQLPPTDDEVITVSISADGYNSIEAEIDATSSAINNAQLVNSPRNYFITRRSGQYDLYSSKLDGSDQELIIPGTGSETNDIRLSIDPANQNGALVSTRNGIRDSDGRLQTSLHMVALEEPSINEIDSSQDIQLVGWINTSLVYVRIGEGESAFSPRRHQIMSYDTVTKKVTELEASNHFNDVKVIQNKIYYAADDSFKQESPKPYLYTMDVNGQNKRALIERQSWTIFQSSYNEIIVNTTKNGWFSYDIARDEVSELSGQPSILADRRYEDSPGAEKSAWVDQRDGKGVLVVYNPTTKQEDVVHSFGGLQAPIRWINDDKIIFRISNSQETADYIVDLGGGEPQKITDTSNISSATRWFYY